MAKRREKRLAVFEELFSTHYAALFALGYHLSHDRELTKDELQSFFLELWEKQIALAELDYPLAYLRKSFARKMLRSLQKRRKEQAQVSSTINTNTVAPSSEDLLIKLQEQDQQDKALHAAIAQLPLEQRNMLNERFLKGLSYSEIATNSGKSKQTVYNQIYEALKKVKKSLLLGAVSLLVM